jgi:hypothetical protein
MEYGKIVSLHGALPVAPLLFSAALSRSVSSATGQFDDAVA